MIPSIVWWFLFFCCSGCIGLVCPCYLFGKNAEFLGSGTLMGSCTIHFILWALVNSVCCLVTDGLVLGLPGCFVACYACGYRRAIRSKYNLQVCLLYWSPRIICLILEERWCRFFVILVSLGKNNAAGAACRPNIGQDKHAVTNFHFVPPQPRFLYWEAGLQGPKASFTYISGWQISVLWISLQSARLLCLCCCLLISNKWYRCW